MEEYSYLDSGSGRKLEKFGSVTLIRPCAVALWKPSLSPKVWDKADGEFCRLPENKWIFKNESDDCWLIKLRGLKFKLQRTSFGHVGIFPEHSQLWDWMEKEIEKGLKGNEDFNFLNLFAYSGAATLFAAKCGAKVCHLDASAPMVDRARENAELNGLENHPIRWIVDDVFKFLKREERRERKYEAIILDPPSFGRGKKGEVFKIEEDLISLLVQVHSLLSDRAQFVILTCHTPGITPLTLYNVMKQIFKTGLIEVGEIALSSPDHDLPGGIYVRWSRS
jgi:23S rRNA (cytosine1962-C5)-methyltransferase